MLLLAKHIRTRAGRKCPAEVNIEPLWASEAALDPNRLVRRGTGRESVEVLGYSPSARRVLLVWIYTTQHPPGGSWQGRRRDRSRPQVADSILGRTGR